jgi:hypothetical protein
VKNKLFAIAFATAALVGTAAAELETTVLTEAVTDGIDKAEVILIAGMGVLGLFIVYKLIRRGASKI